MFVIWGVALQIGALLTSFARDHSTAATFIGIVLTALAVASVGGIIVIALAALATITNLAAALETSGVICGGVISVVIIALTVTGLFAKSIPAFLIANATNAYGGMGDCPI